MTIPLCADRILGDHSFARSGTHPRITPDVGVTSNGNS